MRLFAAVLPPADVRAGLANALASLRDRPDAPRWMSSAGWHVTVSFFGEVDDAVVPALEAALEPVCRATAPLGMGLAGGGHFPERGTPRILWAGLRGDLEGLRELAEAVGKAAVAADVPPEHRPFRPHLTLGRWRADQTADRGLADALASYSSPLWTVNELALVRSNLGRTPHYETVRGFPLAGYQA